ncbi:CDP-alcohol phosphatidyltransferase family protein [Maridesulfovibrio sp.]|uniref:CDP-alcohol phosphatidyltransferase family protein n=1 Tax=Maridesulfovibrio sp. TaxID=2795000 RepID=UPI002A18E2B2|nr:CDP-alcohol phosphatidyltransferase family protein [Maridesulfovibrio sp.]
MSRQNILTIPNIITFLRILFTPLFVGAFLGRDFVAAWWFFVLAGISDGFDGFLARLLDQRSEFGAVLDPLADKFLLVASFLCLTAYGLVPLWLAVLAVLRDTVIVGGLVLLRIRGLAVEKRIDPLWSSKITTALQILLVFCVLCDLAFDVDPGVFKALLVWCVAAFTLFSGASYLRLGLGMFAETAKK